MINIALVGTWHVHFDGYARMLEKNEKCKITCLWDDNNKKGKDAAKKYNCEFVSDYDELLKRDDVDAIQVCTSTDLHKEIIIKAARAKKHIFTEKVLCFTEKDALEVAEEVKKSGIKFCISFPWKCRSDFQWMINACKEGLLGEIRYCRMRNAHNGVSSGWLPATFLDKETCGGGAMMDLGAHGMYFLNTILGRAEKASSSFTNVMVDTVEDNAVTVLTYKNGAIGVNETGFITANNPFEVEIAGERGTILAGGFMDKVCFNIGNGWQFPVLPPAKPEPIDMWIDDIDNDTDNSFGIDEAVELSYVMELAYKNI